MTIKPIEILTPNLLEDASLSDFQGEALIIKRGVKNTVNASITACFAQAVTADKILIKNTDAQSLTIKYKTASSDDNFSLFENFEMNISGSEAFITF